MAGEQRQKGNPASKRMINAELKARRARSWAAGKKRRDAHRKAQEERHQHNLELKAQGLPTPWEQAKAKAREKRGV